MKVDFLTQLFKMPVVWPCRCYYSKYDNSCSFHGVSFPKAGSPGIEVDKPGHRREI